MGAVKNLCNCGVLIEKGRIICSDTVDTVIRRYDKINASKFLRDDSKKYDIRNKRGYGAIHFAFVSLPHDTYTTQDDINIYFTIESSAPLYKIYFSLLIKHESGEPLTTITYVLENTEVPKGYKKSFNLEIPKQTFRPGRYPIYLWLGDEFALTQNGEPTNYEVLDEFLQPLFIELSEADKMNSLSRNILGQVSIRSKLREIEEK
jgi:hypothetical protein